MLHVTTLFITGLLMIIGQTSFPMSDIRPNLLIIIIVHAGQFCHPVSGMLISFALGYLLDSLGGSLLGLNAFSMVLICYLSYVLSKAIVTDSAPARILAIFLFYTIYSLIVYSLFIFFDFSVQVPAYLKNNLIDACITSVISLPVISIIKWMEKKFGFDAEVTPGDIKI